MTLGQRVYQLRKEKGLTQEQLADAIGVDRSYIGHIESGKTGFPGKEVLFALAEVLETTPEDLLAAAGYLRPPATPTEPLPSYHTYVRRKFRDDPKLQKALIAAFEAIVGGREEEEERIREARKRTRPGRQKQ